MFFFKLNKKKKIVKEIAEKFENQFFVLYFFKFKLLKKTSLLFYNEINMCFFNKYLK